MATYNGERFLREQLDSILDQSCSPSRIVVTDDGSTDRTGEILESYARKCRRIAYYPGETRLGWIKNFERGISLCDTDIIALADQDDVWMPEKLEACVDRMSAEPGCGLCYHDAGLIYEDGNLLDMSLWEASEYDYPLSSDSARSILLDTRSPLSGFTLVFEKDLKDLVLPFPGYHDCAHDWWISAVAFFLGAPVAVDDKLVNHRLHHHQTIGHITRRLTGTDRRVKKPLLSLERIRRNVRRELHRLLHRRQIKLKRESDRLRRKQEFAHALDRVIYLMTHQGVPPGFDHRESLIQALSDRRQELISQSSRDGGGDRSGMVRDQEPG